MYRRTKDATRGYSTPAERLEKLKSYPYAREGETWRDTFKSAPWVRAPGLDFTHHKDKLNASSAEDYSRDYRGIGYADEIVSRGGLGTGIDHTGWFADEIQAETVRGFVVQFPSRDGQPQYYAGADWSDSDCATLDLSECFGSSRDAAYRADDLARKYAEDAREHDHAWRMQEERDEKRQAIREKIQHARLILRAIREGAEGLAARLLEDEYATLRAEISQDRESLEEWENEHDHALSMVV